MSLDTEDFRSSEGVIEAFHSREWTDGLPIVPPEDRLVQSMLAAGGRTPEQLLGDLSQRACSFAVWQAAVCSVMAGCLPEYFPVVLATWDALFDPRVNLHAVLSSTGGAAIAGVVSGPYADEIAMNSGANVFGAGNRANASIGRAIRLGAIAALKAVPGVLDASSFGHGGKYSFHFAERRPPEGWPTIREQLGYSVSESTVTILPSDAPRQVSQRFAKTASGLLATIAACMKDPSHNGALTSTYYIVVLGPEHAHMLADAGMSPAQVRTELSWRSSLSAQDLAEAGVIANPDLYCLPLPEANSERLVASPEHILVMTAGGFGAGWSAVIPCWAGPATTHPASAAVVVGDVPSRSMRPHDPDSDSGPDFR